MLLRIAGIVFFCLGAALAALGLGGAIHGAALASFSTELARSRNQPFDAPTWLAHWRAWSLAVTCAGIAIGVAGVGVALKKRWGFLLFGIALLASAIAPWAVQWLGLVRYRFERADLADTMVLTAFALLAIWGYFLRTQGRRNT